MKSVLSLLICCFGFITKLNAQITLPSGTNISTYSDASEGDLYEDENNVIYIGLQDGSLKEIGDVTAIGTNNGDFLIWNATNSRWEASSASTPGDDQNATEVSLAPGFFDANISPTFIGNVQEAVDAFRTSLNSAWKTTGNDLNSGTGSEFLGTTSFHSLNLRTNNQVIGVFQPNGGISLGLNATANANQGLAIGQDSNAALQGSAFGFIAEASGQQATAIGNG